MDRRLTEPEKIAGAIGVVGVFFIANWIFDLFLHNYPSLRTGLAGLVWFCFFGWCLEASKKEDQRLRDEMRDILKLDQSRRPFRDVA